jgi:UDP-N-acetyl-2-amino-2-deoxyglucuronate dehydrogenase
LAGEVKSVKSLAANYAHQRVIEFEDTGVVMMEFASGALGSLNFTINSHQRNMEGSLTIFAEKGTIKIGGKYLNTLEYQSIDNYVISGLEPGNLENDYGFYTGSMSNHGLVYDNVIDVLQRGGAVMTSATDGMKTVEIIERIYQETVRL